MATEECHFCATWARDRDDLIDILKAKKQHQIECGLRWCNLIIVLPSSWYNFIFLLTRVRCFCVSFIHTIFHDLQLNFPLWQTRMVKNSNENSKLQSVHWCSALFLFVINFGGCSWPWNLATSFDDLNANGRTLESCEELLTMLTTWFKSDIRDRRVNNVNIKEVLISLKSYSRSLNWTIYVVHYLYFLQ